MKVLQLCSNTYSTLFKTIYPAKERKETFRIITTLLMNPENTSNSLDISNPIKSGKILIIGLLITLPLFAWWGSHIKIHPIKVLMLNNKGVFTNKTESRWELDINKAQFIKNQNGEWVPFNMKEIKQLPEGDYSLKWQSKNIWSLIGLELF